MLEVRPDLLEAGYDFVGKEVDEALAHVERWRWIRPIALGHAVVIGFARVTECFDDRGSRELFAMGAVSWEQCTRPILASDSKFECGDSREDVGDFRAGGVIGMYIDPSDDSCRIHDDNRGHRDGAGSVSVEFSEVGAHRL
jgi:hypothetical protein